MTLLVSSKCSILNSIYIVTFFKSSPCCSFRPGFSLSHYPINIKDIESKIDELHVKSRIVVTLGSLLRTYLIIVILDCMNLDN